MAVTIKQIAEAAGVSRGTVDRALNNRGGINPEVEKRIRKIAADLNYEPNAVAKALANSHKHNCLIGILINSGANSFFEKVLVGIERASKEAERFGVSTVVEQMSGYKAEYQLARIEKLEKLNLSGLIITPINDPIIIEKLDSMAKSGIAITTMNTDVSGVEKLCFVGCDYEKSGQSAAELLGLMTAGVPTRAAIVTGSHKMFGHTMRVDGFKKVCKTEYPNIEIVDIVETNDDNFLAHDVVGRLLDREKPEALYFCAGGVDGGIKAVIERGLQGKIRIITVDDTENIKKYIRTGVISATICQQPVKQGYDAVNAQFNYVNYGRHPKRKALLTQNEIKLKYNLD